MLISPHCLVHLPFQGLCSTRFSLGTMICALSHATVRTSLRKHIVLADCMVNNFILGGYAILSLNMLPYSE